MASDWDEYMDEAFEVEVYSPDYPGFCWEGTFCNTEIVVCMNEKEWKASPLGHTTKDILKQKGPVYCTDPSWIEASKLFEEHDWRMRNKEKGIDQKLSIKEYLPVHLAQPSGEPIEFMSL